VRIVRFGRASGKASITAADPQPPLSAACAGHADSRWPKPGRSGSPPDNLPR
jgi:hypothetical protein